jgi:hypothetical protein
MNLTHSRLPSFLTVNAEIVRYGALCSKALLASFRLRSSHAHTLTHTHTHTHTHTRARALTHTHTHTCAHILPSRLAMHPRTQCRALPRALTPFPTCCNCSSPSQIVDQCRWLPGDNQVLATASRDQTVKIWDARAGSACCQHLQTRLSSPFPPFLFAPAVLTSEWRLPLYSD